MYIVAIVSKYVLFLEISAVCFLQYCRTMAIRANMSVTIQEQNHAVLDFSFLLLTLSPRGK